MRLCILGNSHVGCIKQAWNSLKEKPDSISLDFFAAGGTGLASLEAKDDCIGTKDEEIAEKLRRTSGGRDFLRPTDYDALLLVGLGVRVPIVIKALSSAVVSQCCEDTISSSLGLRLGEMIRSQTGARIYIGHVPLPPTAKPLSAHRSYGELYELMKSEFDKFDMHLLRQPAETVLFPCSTAMRFSVEAQSAFSGSQTGKIDTHMNVAYGRSYLRDFLERLSRDAAMAESEALQSQSTSMPPTPF